MVVITASGRATGDENSYGRAKRPPEEGGGCAVFPEEAEALICCVVVVVVPRKLCELDRYAKRSETAEVKRESSSH